MLESLRLKTPGPRTPCYTTLYQEYPDHVVHCDISVNVHELNLRRLYANNVRVLTRSLSLPYSFYVFPNAYFLAASRWIRHTVVSGSNFSSPKNIADSDSFHRNVLRWKHYCCTSSDRAIASRISHFINIERRTPKVPEPHSTIVFNEGRRNQMISCTTPIDIVNSPCL